MLSIVLCTRNRAAQLEGALKAISALSGEWEAMIVDNGSTDGTQAVIRDAMMADSRLRNVFHLKPGLGGARNAGWSVATGEVIAFTDDDCYVAEGFAEHVVAPFAEDPMLGFCGGRILPFDHRAAKIGYDLRTEPVTYRPRTFIPAGGIQGSNMAFRRKALEAIGGFDPRLGAGTPFPSEDIDAVARVLWAGYSGRFDPRSTVYHDHRRTEDDVPTVRAGYDRGRGAYYCKGLLSAQARWSYLKGWTAKTLQRPKLGQLRREVWAALHYAALAGR